MARSSQGSFVDKHIEKVILAVCAVLLLFTLVQYVLSTGTYEAPVVRGGAIRSTEVSPGEIDDHIAEAAAALQADIDNKGEPNMPPVPEYKQQFARWQESPLWPKAGQMLAGLNFGQPVPPLQRVDANVPIGPDTVRLADLRKMMPVPEKPAVLAKTVLPEVEEPQDVGLATGAAVYDLATLYANWVKPLQELGVSAAPVALDVEAEIRVRNPDGTWGKPSKMKVIRLAQGEGGKLVEVKMEEVIRPIPAFDGENMETIRQVIQDTASPSKQEFIYQGPYHYIYYGPTREWISARTLLPDNPISEAAAKDPNALDMPEARKGAPVVIRKTQKQDTSKQRRPNRPEPVYPDYPEEIYGPMGPEGPYPTRQPSRRPARRPDQPRVEREEAEVAPPPDPVPLPTLAQQKAMGKLLLVVRNDEIEPGKEYSIRLRVTFLNPVYAQETAVEDPADAKQVSLTTDWSPWSEAFNLPQTNRFFLTGSSRNQGTVKVTVFSRSLGQQVKQNFNVRRGEPIGGKAKLRIPDPITGELREVEVDFATGATAVDFDFDKRVLKGTFATSTVEMLFLSEDGSLETRVRAWDEDSEEYRNLMNLARASERTAKAEQ